MDSASASVENVGPGSESEYVKISDLRAEDTRLLIELEMSKKLKKYFFKTSFAIEYDRKIETQESIMVIPAISLVAPVAWATGADIIVNILDEAYLDSLNKIRRVFDGWFPQLVSPSKIKIRKIISNKIENRKNGLLFSAGLDSMTSYIRNKSEHPSLITLIKTDDQFRYYEKVQNTLQSLAQDDGVEIYFIRSDIWDARSKTLDNKLLEIELHMHGWWDEVSHGLVTLGLCAPLTMVEGIGNLRLASSHAESYNRPHGSHYLLRTKLSWANINIIYDTSDLSRQGKIRNILKGNTSYYKYLRVCVDPSHYRVNDSQVYPRNCGHCEKCLRTIIGLILEGIDPNECNFFVKDDVLQYVKDSFNSGSLNILRPPPTMWQEIQENIPDDMTNLKDSDVARRFSAEAFFEWFKGFDLGLYKPNRYKILKSEFGFSLGHRGVYPTIEQIIGYASAEARKKMRNNRSEHDKDVEVSYHVGTCA